MQLPAWQVLVATLGCYLGMSALTFAVYAIDKAAARRHAWRVPESTLHLLALLGGWPGAVLAQQALRHKTRKQPFRRIFWATVVGNCIGVVGIAWLATVTG